MSDGYLTQDDIDELRDEAIKRKQRYLFMQDWPQPSQCQVRGASKRCPNKAVYRLRREDHEPVEVCDPCSSSWIHTFTKYGPVTIERI